MVESLQIRGYRSLENIRFPLSPLTVVTGANGTGKSNLYRSLQLLARAARGELARAVVEEGGMPSALWSGARRWVAGEPDRVQFLITVQADTFGYMMECGLDSTGLFAHDPQVKRERAWLGRTQRPSMLVLERDCASASLRTAEGERQDYAGDMESTETALAQIQDVRRFPDVAVVRGHFLRWRFYHHFRVDADSPVRQPRPGTYTPSLASDGADIAAALQTIYAIGDRDALDAAIDRMQPGARLELGGAQGDGWLGVGLRSRGLLRPLSIRELSDGTVRYLALIAALLSPRPAPLLAFNEPESSLHPDLLAPLASLFVAASQHSQIWVTTHSGALAQALAEASGHRPIRLELKKGATRIVGQNLLGDIVDEGA
ncbi:MAG: AAA family ATPase [Verrucomicrobiota bacterium]